MKPVIALHGPCGSGKSFLAETINKTILLKEEVAFLNIKDMFLHLAKHLALDFDNMGYPLSEADMKHLCLLIGKFGEERLHKDIWTTQWVNKVSQLGDVWVINDGIRTEMNLEGLIKIAKAGRPVIFFKLNASESVRRARLGPKYRENDVFTSLEKSAHKLPPQFNWVELHEDWNISDIKGIFEEYL